MFAPKKEEKSSQLHPWSSFLVSNLRVQKFGTSDFENAYIRDALLRKTAVLSNISRIGGERVGPYPIFMAPFQEVHCWSIKGVYF